MRTFLMSLSLVMMFVCFPGMAQVVFDYVIIYGTYFQMIAVLNAHIVYPVAGILWMYTIIQLATSYWKSDREEGRLWVVDERYLDACDGIPYYRKNHLDESEIDMEQKPVVVREAL